MTKLALLAIVLGGTLGPGQPAVAQIFGGISNSGAVVLSNIVSDEARTLIVSAPVITASLTQTLPTRRAAASPEAFQSFILEASAASRLPAELIHAVIKTESNYNPRALSIKGAQGLMQLMPATAKRFGSINSLDPRDNILAGSRYLRWLMDYFNQNMELAVAAYNAGEGAVVKAGHKIPPYEETQKYVPKVLERYRQAAGLG
ncbi:MAG: lytic transglycosylase domain-containing protein [Polaromonas sp.]|uniref:lytic transglycosylase domain-containing protein n=1 Tax=Polaromonas sp. TaxID=1869339 RepID=UPI0017C5FB76|nr:lytic transglycosylase domain-containing protein [Polaromonas sp.]NMM08681.1 lytic transglycosylase domain-containing protein [Polaromonas sp.]